MKPIQDQLLKSLGNGVRPFDAVAIELPEGGFDFDALLKDALGGKPKTSLGVRFAPSVSGLFEQADQKLIAQGIDRAASVGVDHALILHNQRTLRVDVRNRIVLEAHRLSDEQVIDGIDGFVSIKALDTQTDRTSDGAIQSPSSGAGFAPARIVRNASLVQALAGQVPD